MVATDGYNMDLLGELHAAAIVSKITSGHGDVASAPELVAAVTSEAAAAINRNDLGAIRPGAAADLTVVDLSHPLCQPVYDPRKALVWLANHGNVEAVMVAGRLLIDGGEYVGGDEAAIVRAGAAAIQKVWDHPVAQAALQ
jgi:cytosine/adenosine deaminase-related metal-dependent hydrolase